MSHRPRLGSHPHIKEAGWLRLCFALSISKMSMSLESDGVTAAKILKLLKFEDSLEYDQPSHWRWSFLAVTSSATFRSWQVVLVSRKFVQTMSSWFWRFSLRGGENLLPVDGNQSRAIQARADRGLFEHFG